MLISGDGHYNDVLDHLRKKDIIYYGNKYYKVFSELISRRKMVWEWRSLAVGGRPLTPKIVQYESKRT